MSAADASHVRESMIHFLCTNEQRSNKININFHPVLQWYRQHARDLPWRLSQNPYAIWVSEIMLQQTTVATVVPYFQRFLALWPTVEDLAAADLNDVLHAWQGLGYYRRARHLHAAACVIAKEGWPQDVKGLQSLPGIGSYTARAVAAMAWNISTLPIDGNIARIMARVLGLKGPKINVTKQLEKHDWGEIPEPGHVAQALMDLGQSICTPRQPQCAACPLQAQCRSPGSQPFEDVPITQRRMYTQAFCMADEHNMLMCEEANLSAPSEKLLQGLWGPIMMPWREEPYDTNIINHPQAVQNLVYCGAFTHVFSHIRLTVDVYKSSSPIMMLPHHPFSRLATKILNVARLVLSTP